MQVKHPIIAATQHQQSLFCLRTAQHVRENEWVWPFGDDRSAFLPLVAVHHALAAGPMVELLAVLVGDVFILFRTPVFYQRRSGISASQNLAHKHCTQIS